MFKHLWRKLTNADQIEALQQQVREMSERDQKAREMPPAIGPSEAVEDTKPKIKQFTSEPWPILRQRAEEAGRQLARKQAQSAKPN